MIPQSPFVFTLKDDPETRPFFHTIQDTSVGESAAVSSTRPPPPENSPKRRQEPQRDPPPVVPHTRCFKDLCKCTMYEPQVFLPLSLCSDSDWEEILPRVKAMASGAPIVRRVVDGRFLRVNGDREDPALMPRMMTFFEEYRQVKIMFENSADASKRDDDPFNSTNWSPTNTKGRVGSANLLCTCGHVDFWHRPPSDFANEDPEETTADTHAEPAADTHVEPAADTHVEPPVDTAENASVEACAETAKAPIETDSVGGGQEENVLELSGEEPGEEEQESEPQVRLENGRLVVPRKSCESQPETENG